MFTALSLLVSLLALIQSASAQTGGTTDPYAALQRPASTYSLSAWSAQVDPGSTISKEGSWQRLGKNASVVFTLQRASVVVVSYSLNVAADKPFYPGGDFLKSGGVLSAGPSSVSRKASLDIKIDDR